MATVAGIMLLFISHWFPLSWIILEHLDKLTKDIFYSHGYTDKIHINIDNSDMESVKV